MAPATARRRRTPTSPRPARGARRRSTCSPTTSIPTVTRSSSSRSRWRTRRPPPARSCRSLGPRGVHPRRQQHSDRIELTYVVSDDFAATDEGKVVVSVRLKDANNEPDARNDAGVTVVGKPVRLDVLHNDTDPDNDPLFIAQLPTLVRPENQTADRSTCHSPPTASSSSTRPRRARTPSTTRRPTARSPTSPRSASRSPSRPRTGPRRRSATTWSSPPAGPASSTCSPTTAIPTATSWRSSATRPTTASP